MKPDGLKALGAARPVIHAGSLEAIKPDHPCISL
jgi:hypothetical protein